LATHLTPQLLESLACVREHVSRASPEEIALMAPILCELAIAALARIGQGEEPSQEQRLLRGTPGTVHDVWITPSEAAKRLGRSERWLRRRRWSSPYSAFCIPADSGRGFRVSLQGLEEHMERERKRAARE
jgi:hypothetical protein